MSGLVRRDAARRCVALVAMVAAAATAAGAQDAQHGDHAMAWGRETYLLVDQAEFRDGRFGQSAQFVLRGWWGGAVQRLWFGAEAEVRSGQAPLKRWLDAKYGQLVAPFWDLQVGLWLRDDPGAAVTHGPDGGVSFGFHGLAPGWFEVESALRVSIEGDFVVDLAAAYDLYLTQRLVLDPRVETTWRLRPLPESSLASGFAHTEAGLRLRYELSRRFAPYIGYAIEREVFDPPGSPLERRTDRIVRIGVRAWR